MIAIVGAGFGGLCMAIRLQQAGIDDFVVLEKASEVGGTWRENTYPGCGCDVMSLMYSFSFAPKRDWSRMYARQEEILAYLRDCADSYGLRANIRFNTEVTGMEFDDDADEWRLFTSAGDVRARAVVAAQGPLHIPHVPDLPGLSDFSGKTFHSAEWDHSYDLTGKRVAVIGTGASAVQFIPRIARRAAHVEVFQRTPNWILPKLDRRISGTEHALFRSMPGVQKAYRNAIYWSHEALIGAFLNPRWMKGVETIARRHLARQVPDRGLRRALTPEYTMGCKRILISSDYYPALMRPNVSLITSGISSVTPEGVRTQEGTVHDADAIIFGTGFHVTDAFAHAHLVGRDGLTIQDAWRNGPAAHLGVSVAGFPNFFLLMGPNSGGGNQSVLFMIEAQVGYIMDCLRMMRRAGSNRIEVRRSVQTEFNRWAHRRLAGSVWNAGGCDSWYLDSGGVNRAAWPGSSVSYWWRMRRPDPDEYVFQGIPSDDSYRGPATITSGETSVRTDVHLAGHFEPIDGSYRWYGRVTADPALPSPGPDDVLINVAGGSPATARLTELDPWGNTRITGTGAPPFPVIMESFRPRTALRDLRSE